MTARSFRRTVRAVALATCLLAVAVTSVPFAHASTCEWGFGPLQFRCEGTGGCIPGLYVGPQGAGAGCTAWDRPT